MSLEFEAIDGIFTYLPISSIPPSLTAKGPTTLLPKKSVNTQCSTLNWNPASDYWWDILCENLTAIWNWFNVVSHFGEVYIFRITSDQFRVINPWCLVTTSHLCLFRHKRYCWPPETEIVVAPIQWPYFYFDEFPISLLIVPISKSYKQPEVNIHRNEYHIPRTLGWTAHRIDIRTGNVREEIEVVICPPRFLGCNSTTIRTTVASHFSNPKLFRICEVTSATSVLGPKI